jgi:hypothetical protein
MLEMGTEGLKMVKNGIRRVRAVLVLSICMRGY